MVIAFYKREAIFNPVSSREVLRAGADLTTGLTFKLNTKMELQNIRLEEKDFDLLMEALEHLPNKDMAGDLMMGILGAALIKGENEDDFKNHLAKQERDKKAKREALIEDIRLLQSKIIMLKRHFIEKGLMADINNQLGV